MTSTDTDAARVARGAALLDTHRPGWRARVDPDALDMSSFDRCLLGQAYGCSFTRAAERLRWDANAVLYPDIAWKVDHGFVTSIRPLALSNQDYDEQVPAADRALADAWRAELGRGGGHGDV